VATTLCTLLVGLVLTAGFAILAVGELNMISVAFAVLYIGLGVDFAIHLCLRYGELTPSQPEGPAALLATARDVGPSLVLCTLTTAAGFYAFVPTAYAGMSELGLISGTGMFISLATSLTLLPALLRIWPIKRPAPPAPTRAQAVVGALSRLPYRHARGILWGAGVLGVGAAALLPQLRFDYNSINLRAPESESVSTFKELFHGPATPLWHITVLAHDHATAARYTAALRRLDPVKEVIWIQDLIPDQQEERLELIEDLALIMGPQLDVGPNHEVPVAAQLEALERFDAHLRAYLSHPRNLAWRQTIASLQGHVQALRDRLLTMSESSAAHALQGLERDLQGSLPRALQRLRTALAAAPITLDGLPAGLRSRWVSARAIHRIEVYPREDITDSAALKRFVTAVQTVTPQATGAPVLNLEAGSAIVLAFQQAFAGALAVILILLVVTLRNLMDPLAVVIPLLYGALLTTAALTLAGIAFNFANIIALPLLLGIGVDNGIHMVHRLRRFGSPANLLRTTTARAIVLSALTTLVSFANLSFSAHPGTASLGRILTLGIALILVSTLLILPALLKVVHGKPPEP
jgi:hopanoid biosynthesis associated RND transporter like protein HpnN